MKTLMKKMMTILAAAVLSLFASPAFCADADPEAVMLGSTGGQIASGTIDEMMDEINSHEYCTIRLAKSCTSKAVYDIYRNATIDLNNKTLTIDCADTQAPKDEGKTWLTFYGDANMKLTITNGYFTINNSEIYSTSAYDSTRATCGLVEHKGQGVVYVSKLTTMKDTRYPVVMGEKGRTYVNGCTFKGSPRKFSGVSAAGGYVEVSDTTIVTTTYASGESSNPWKSTPVRASDKGTLKILSGWYEAAFDKGMAVQTCTSGADIFIEGGTFKGCLRLDGPNKDVIGTAVITGGTFDFRDDGYDLETYITPGAGFDYSQNQFKISGGSFNKNPTVVGDSRFVKIQSGYQVKEESGRYVVVEKPTKATVQIDTGDHVSGGTFSISGSEESYSFPTNMEAKIGATVTITSVICDEGYVPSHKVGETFTVPEEGMTLTIEGVEPVADVYIEADGVYVYGGSFSVGEETYEFGNWAEGVPVGAEVRIDEVIVEPGYVPNYKEGDVIEVPEEGLYITVTAEEQQGFSLVVKAGDYVKGGTFTVDDEPYEFSEAVVTVEEGQTVTITSVRYELGYDQDGTYVKNYSEEISADATWEVTGKAVEPGADPVLPQDVTPQEAGVTNQVFKDAQPVEVKGLIKWQATYQDDGANINIATFDADGQATNDQATGYLLDCAPTAEAIAAAKEDFSAEITIDADGNPVVNIQGEEPDATTYGNGTLKKLGAAEVTGPWSEDLKGAHFFKFQLVK